DSTAVERETSELLGTWKGATPYQRIVISYKEVQRINAKIETPDKENTQFSAGLRLRMKDTDPDYAAMVMANYIFGGGITPPRPDRVRNREGYSYTLSTTFPPPPDSNAAAFSH